jgi:hypothetical protein
LTILEKLVPYGQLKKVDQPGFEHLILKILLFFPLDFSIGNFGILFLCHTEGPIYPKGQIFPKVLLVGHHRRRRRRRHHHHQLLVHFGPCSKV